MTQTIERSSILIPENRIRRQFDPRALAELALSIRTKGLFHPPVLRNDSRTLIAGERRLRAMDLLFTEGVPFYHNEVMVTPAMVPFVRISELGVDSLLEAELEENTIRRDLNWKERAQAITALHSLRQHQTDGSQTMRDTAAEITGTLGGGATTLVRDAIIVSRHLDDPDVAAATDQRQAISVIKKKQEQTFLAALGRSGAINSSNTFLPGAAEQVLLGLPTASYDLILTDPPYGMEMTNSGQALLQHTYDDSPEHVLPMLEVVIGELTRLTKPHAHLYMFCDFEHFGKLSLMLTMRGWQVWRTPLIWYKGNQGFLPRPDHGPRRTYEMILFANKGGKPVEVRGAHDVISVPQDQSLIHPAQKPEALYVELMSRSSRPGDSVLDPFCGRGTVFLAASKKALLATGIELDEKMAGIARAAAGGTR